MADFPGYPKPPPFLSTWSRFSSCWEVANTATSFLPASAAWGAANTAKFIPISIPFAYLVNRVFWVNGSVVASSNHDFGIYAADGTRLYSTGSTAAVGASVIQFVTPASPILLYPGDYYFAHVNNGTTNRVFGNAIAAVQQRYAGIKQQATALPLPASATFAAPSTTTLSLCGVTWTTSGF